MKHFSRPCLFLIFLLIFSLPTSQLTAAMISTDRVVADMAQERARIQAFVHRNDVQKKMVELGVSPEEASRRVATLSDSEVKTIAGHLDQLHAGGDGIYLGLGALILIAILVILLVRR